MKRITFDEKGLRSPPRVLISPKKKKGIALRPRRVGGAFDGRDRGPRNALYRMEYLDGSRRLSRFGNTSTVVLDECRCGSAAGSRRHRPSSRGPWFILQAAPSRGLVLATE
ncbi:hypothetical protein MRX96_024296 [Rhipicephalus microplus]